MSGCPDREEALAALALEEALPQPAATDLFAHLGACAGCRDRVGTLKTLAQGLRGSPEAVADRSRRLTSALTKPRLSLGERTYTLADLPLTMGRSQTCELPLDDPGCSRQHARINWAGNRFVLEDLESANGTRLNGRPVRLEPLSDGDRIQVGSADLRVRILPPPSLEASGGPAPARLRFAVTLGRNAWIHEIAKPEETAGRGRRVDLRLDDPGCSREHLRLTRQGEALRFRDLGSANGTRLNGASATEGTLKAGDVLELGAARLAFHPLLEGQRGGAGAGTELELTLGGRSEVFEMGKSLVLVGRGADCDIRIEDPACSRQQARLEQRHDGLWLTDLGGTNPTLLNGDPAGEIRLRPGDILGFGAATLRILPAEAAPAPETPVPEPDQPRKRTLLTHRPPPARHAWAAALVALGGLTGLGLAFWVAWEIRGRPGPLPSVPVAEVPTPGPERPPDGAREAGILLDSARALEAARPGDWEALAFAYEEVARRFPGTSPAGEALLASRAVQARQALARDEAFEKLLASVRAARGEGDLRAARACLTGFLEANAATRHAQDIQGRLAELDAEMEGDYLAMSAGAMANAREGRFNEARASLKVLQRRYAGLPWGSAAEVRLEELVGLEAEAAVRHQEDLARLRAEAEAKRSAEEREKLRDAWTARQADLVRLLKDMPAKGKEERQALFASLAAFDPALGPKALEALQGEHQKLHSRLKGKLSSATVQSLRKDLEGDLGLRRKAALDLIYDVKRYPYFPDDADRYGPDGAKVQREVDDLVEKVEAVWKPAQALLEAVRGLKGMDAVLDGLAELEGYLAQIGKPQAPERTAGALLNKTLKTMNFSEESEAAEENAKILKDNEALFKKLKGEGGLNDEEFDCILITNRYRIMMGLKPLRIEPKLVSASRGHSRHMAEAGFFAHVDPDGKGPGERAREASFFGPCGENIVMGRPTGRQSFEAWKSSSGHHRNMLMPNWTLIGVGQHNLHYTMMLGL